MRRAQRIPHPINRSLTPAECEIQRQYNLRFGEWAAKMIAEPLLQHHPETPPYATPRLPRELLEEIAERNREAGEELSRRMPPEEALELGVPEAWVRENGEAEPLILSKAQIEIIAEHTSRYLHPDNLHPDKPRESLRISFPRFWTRLPFFCGKSHRVK